MQCLVAMKAKINETRWIWHHRLAHVSMNLILKLVRKVLVNHLPKINFENKNLLCMSTKETN